jgi:hypothetical protein
MSDDPVLTRVSRHLAPIEDVSLLLLKSHLLVEQQINAALHKILPGFASLDVGRLTYQQRIQVIRALDGTRKAEDALRFAERLNLVRNRLANQLEPIGIDDAIAGFVTEMAASVPIKFDEALPLDLRMTMCIGYICSMLDSFEAATSVRSKI